MTTNKDFWDNTLEHCSKEDKDYIASVLCKQIMYERDLAVQQLKELGYGLGEKPEESKGKWIPVSKRLPEEGHVVYCQLTDGSHAVLYVQDNWGQMEWVDGMMGTGTYDVIAWRELPENYKAESEDRE